MSGTQPLSTRQARAARPELVTGTITGAIGWLRTHLPVLRSAAAFTDELARAVSHSLTAGQARYLAELRDAVDAACAHLDERAAEFGDTFGEMYSGIRTDVTAIRSVAEWARQLRIMITGSDAPLSPAQVKAAAGALPASQLAAAAIAWQQAGGALVEAFNADRRADLTAELDEYEDAADLSSQPCGRTPGAKTSGTRTRPAAPRSPPRPVRRH